MSGRKMTSEGLRRLESRVRVIHGLVRMVFVVFCTSFGFLVVATAIPQKRELEKLETRLVSTKENEQRVLAEQEQRRVELRALREDPSYLEIHARDRLDYCSEGERILRFRRDQ